MRFYGRLSIINDQLSLEKGDASSEDILLQQKQLATAFTYWTSIGFNYRFGSNRNNVVNPRFDF